MLFRFVGVLYIKYLIIIFVSLQMFFMGIDVLKYIDLLPDSANLLILFFVYDFLYALNYTLSISTILACIACCIVLIRTNQFSAMLSIGISKKKALLPIIIISGSINLFYILLNSTSFVYAQENVDNILQRASINNSKSDILVKYKNNYIYIGKIYPILQKAENIKIFEIDNLNVNTFIYASEANFDGIYWILKQAIINKIPKEPEFGKTKLDITKVNNYKILKDFKPKILDTFYQNKPNVSIPDAINAYFLLKDENLNTDKVRSMLYSFLAIPISAFCILGIIAFYMPSLPRYVNLAKLGFCLVLFSLIIWGIFFTLSKLSISGFILGEFGILIPLLIFIVCCLLFYNAI